jgi:uncharacterized beta-barrel protein YwiB (DUF1934 family)
MEVTIHSVIDNLDDGVALGDPEISIISLPAIIVDRDSGYVLSYTEEQEGVKIHTDITVMHDGTVHLVRTGGVEWDVLFREGEAASSLYKIPPYSFDAEIKPRRVYAKREGDGCEIRLVYSMLLGGGQKDVKMRITAK